MISEKIKQELLNSLRQVDPHKIILFGSQTTDRSATDSDLDVLVITKDDYIPQSFREKTELYLRVAATLGELEKEIPIDLIVHTRPMHQKFLELGSMFSKAIVKNGIVLYEKAH